VFPGRAKLVKRELQFLKETNLVNPKIVSIFAAQFLGL
jgi:hypothetical protein